MQFTISEEATEKVEAGVADFGRIVEVMPVSIPLPYIPGRRRGYVKLFVADEVTVAPEGTLPLYIRNPFPDSCYLFKDVHVTTDANILFAVGIDYYDVEIDEWTLVTPPHRAYQKYYRPFPEGIPIRGITETEYDMIRVNISNFDKTNTRTFQISLTGVVAFGVKWR